jgi:hypothetical protein
MAVNLMLVAVNLMILSQLQRISFPEIATGPARVFGALKTRRASEDKTLLKVHSASDEKMAERENLRRQAEHLEGEALISKTVEEY